MITPEARIAVLEANYMALDRRAADHEIRDEQRFERTFSFIKQMKEDILESVGNLDDKFTEKFIDLEKNIDPFAQKTNTLWDEKNQRRGAFRVSRFVMGVVAGIMGSVVTLIVEWVKK